MLKFALEAARFCILNMENINNRYSAYAEGSHHFPQREFVSPCEVSDTDAASQCYEPNSATSCREYSISADRNNRYSAYAEVSHHFPQREFVSPCEASDADAASQCYEPNSATSCREYSISADRNNRYSAYAEYLLLAPATGIEPIGDSIGMALSVRFALK